ncbi:uncharacterized protein [Diabrotica undecimpunctata]|uniref:uncharacterized protein n=1 Tax=Diabrotica undecimpunctata TaxID=50387 RepID=UPI003B63A67E
MSRDEALKTKKDEQRNPKKQFRNKFKKMNFHYWKMKIQKKIKLLRIVQIGCKLDVAVSDCRSIISDSSVDLSTSIDPHEASGTEPTLRTPFTSDLGLSSNRSSVVSQDDHQSPDSPNAFQKFLKFSSTPPYLKIFSVVVFIYL